jgi:hypothetical protein
MDDHESLDVIGQRVHADTEDGGDVDSADGRFLERAQFVLEFLVPVEHVLRGLVEEPALFGQFDRPFAAIDQLAFVRQFQLRKLLRDGRLAQQVLLGGFREAPQISQIAKCSQCLYVHYKSD